MYFMQAASCLWEEEYQGEYCRLIRVSVIIVGYVRFRLKLNLEAILESKAILLQKICSGHQNERIALRLCQPKFVNKLDCRFFFFFHFMQYSYRVCNPCGRKIRNLGQFYQFIKTANTSKANTPVRAANILLTCRTKPAQHGENQNLSMSIHGHQSHPRSKVPRRLRKANQESLSPFLFWRKLKSKSLI